MNIDAEKLKAEIERRRLSNRYIDTEGYEAELFKIIDSLQQEQPEVNLEKEVSKWWDASFPEPDFKFRKHRAHIVSNDEIINLARHFYELGRNSK